MVMSLKQGIVVLVVVAAIAGRGVTSAPVACGQDNPFGGGVPVQSLPRQPAAPPSQAPGTTTPSGPMVLDDSVPRSTRVIVESLRALNPVEPEALSAAIRTMLDLQMEQEARYYLNKLVSLNLDESQMVALMDSEGSDFFLTLHASPILAPEGRAFAKQVLAVSSKNATSPETLSRLVDQLGHESLEVRSGAFQKLRRTGPVAVARLIERFATETVVQRVLRMRTALRSMGPQALLPLLGTVDATHLQVRYEVLTALARLKLPDAMYAAAGATLAPGQPEEIREAVLNGVVETWGPVSDPTGVMRRSQQRTEDLLYGVAQLPRNSESGDTFEYWDWDPATNTVTSSILAATTVARLVALDRARELGAFNPADPQLGRLHLLAWLDSAKRVAGPIEVLDLESAKNEFPGMTAPRLDESIRLALQANLFPAAAGAADLLGQMPDAADLLVNNQAGLIRALQSGDRHTQFAALRAITAINPERGFAGSSFYLDSLLMLAGYSEQRAVLICHPDDLLARNLAVAASHSGFTGLISPNSIDLFEQAAADANIQLLMIDHRMGRPDMATLVQQLRADWRTRRLPLAILTSETDTIRSERIAQRDPLTIVLPYTSDERLVSLQLNQLEVLSDDWTVDQAQAIIQSEWAVNRLVEIASDRQRYGFLELTRYRERLVDLLDRPRFSGQAITIVESLGTAEAQQGLIAFASRAGNPLELRTAAALAFGRSIRQRGILLTTDEIRAQYDRYNSSENEGADSQRILGSILDQIEQRSSPTETGAGDGRD